MDNTQFETKENKIQIKDKLNQNGWGHIFMTGLTIMGLHFNQFTRMGSQIFGFLG